MLKIEIEIGTASAAFDRGADAEVLRILDGLLDRWRAAGGVPEESRWLYDLNGNRVGFAETVWSAL